MSAGQSSSKPYDHAEYPKVSPCMAADFTACCSYCGCKTTHALFVALADEHPSSCYIALHDTKCSHIDLVQDSLHPGAAVQIWRPYSRRRRCCRLQQEELHGVSGAVHRVSHGLSVNDNSTQVTRLALLHLCMLSGLRDKSVLLQSCHAALTLCLYCLQAVAGLRLV